MTDDDRPDLQKLAMFDIIHAPRPWKFPATTPEKRVMTDIEKGVRDLISRLENMPYQPGLWPDPVIDRWYTNGQDDAYDNVLDWLYNILGEKR